MPKIKTTILGNYKPHVYPYRKRNYVKDKRT